MKKFAFCFLITLLAICGVVSVKAASCADVYINGKYLDCENGAYIENGRTMVPARSIFECLGATVSWNGESRCVTAEKDGILVRMWIGNSTLVVDGSVQLMDTMPVIVNNLTYVPARAVSQALSANVTWVPKLYAVNITSDGNDTLASYPAVVLPNLSTFDAECVLRDDGSVCFSVTVADARDFGVPESIIELVKKYESTMTDIGWQKNAVVDTEALFETEFTSNTLSYCPYKVTFFIKDSGDGKYLVFVSATDYITVYNTDSGEIRSITDAEFVTLPEYIGSAWKKSLGKRVTLYGTYNNEVQVFDYETHPLRLDGYTEYEKTVTMYSPEGNMLVVKLQQISEFLSAGYVMYKDVKMYSPDGRTEYVGADRILGYIEGGWSVSPFYVLLYAADGSIVTAERHVAEEYLSGGWSTVPYVIMYRMSETIYVQSDKVMIYEQAGWSLIPPSAEGEEESGALVLDDNSTVYITPSGKKYHVSQKCAGSGAIPKILREVKSVYGSCKTCTDNK